MERNYNEHGRLLWLDAYRQYHARATRAIQAERFPQEILEAIDHDAAGTLPVIKIFQSGSPMHRELKDLLCAWYISRLDEGQGYVSGDFCYRGVTDVANSAVDAGYTPLGRHAAHDHELATGVHIAQKPPQPPMSEGILFRSH